MMNPYGKFSKSIKKILIGRDLQVIDKIIFYLSRGKSSGWVLGNKLRNLSYGKRNFISNAPIIFIGCFPRSGSTLLTAMLEQHKEIVGPGSEIHIFQDIKTKRWLKEGFELGDKEIKRFEKYKKDVVLFADKIIRYYLKKKKGSYVLLKQPKHIYFIDEIMKHFPNSKFIHIIRDGRDCTMSQRFFLLPKGRIEWPYSWCCRQWTTAIKKGEIYRKDKRYLEIKYEELVKNPQIVFKEIFNFLEIKNISKRDLLSFYQNFYVHKRPQHKDVGKPLDATQINKWVAKMSVKDKKTFRKICGKEQRALRYKLE